MTPKWLDAGFVSNRRGTSSVEQSKEILEAPVTDEELEAQAEVVDQEDEDNPD